MADSISDMPEDSGLLMEIKDRYLAAREHSSKWRTEARECFAIYAGDQWTEDERQKLIEQQRVPVTFNRTAVLVDAVIGYEVNNRQETRYIPRTQGDAKVNELLTEAANFFRDQCDAEFEESDAFRDMIISGMGWTNDRLSDESNPEFDLVRDRVDPLRMLWDPSSRKPNLEDSRFLFYEANMSKEEAKALVPEWDGDYLAADWIIGDDELGDEHTRNPRQSYQGKDGDNTPTRGLKVLEYQWCKDEMVHVVTNPMTGQTMEMSDEQWTEADDADKEALAQFKATKRVRQWKRAFLIGGEIFVKDHPYGSGPTYHCITGKRDRNTGYWFGVVRSLKDPQKWSNKWLSQIMHLINTAAKPGYDVEKGAVENVKDFETRAARPGAINTFIDGALQQGRVQRREASGLPPDLANLMTYANDSMSNVSGINQELLGMADREQAGVLEYQRKQSAVTLLAPLFDSFRRYRKMAGRCWLHFMTTYLSDGRLIRITRDDGSQMNMPFQPGPVGDMPGPESDDGQETVQQFFDPEVMEYDVIVDQSSASPNLKEATWGALQPFLQLVADRLGPEELMLVLEYSPIPESFLEKMKQITDQKAQQPPPPDPEQQKLQMMQQAKQVELEMRAQETQQQMQVDQAKTQQQLELDREKTAAQIQLEREKAAAQIEIDRQKLAFEQEKAAIQIEHDRHRMALDHEKARHDMDIRVQKMERETTIKADKEKPAKEVLSAANALGGVIKDISSIAERMQEAAGHFSNATNNMMKPKRIVRDPKTNRAIGVETVN